jgi:hypothetical protein
VKVALLPDDGPTGAYFGLNGKATFMWSCYTIIFILLLSFWVLTNLDAFCMISLRCLHIVIGVVFEVWMVYLDV